MQLRFYLILIVIIGIPFTSFSQGGNDIDYQSEFIWGINKNTSSGLIGGFIFKKSKALSSRVYRTIGLEIINVKHPKEERYNARITGNLFIWDKANYLYTFRGQYGRDIILFRKAPQQGVQITAIGAAGPSIGLITPYYIEYNVGQFGGFDSVREPFDPGKHEFTQILGTGRLFQGVPKSDLTLGLNIKAGLSFEFGTFKRNVTGFEVGFLVDAYTKEVILVPNAENYAVFPTAYFTLFYGSRK